MWEFFCTFARSNLEVMQKFVFDPYTPPKLAYAQKVKCAYPNCQCDAINSHLLQKNRWLKQIAEDGKVLQMSDEQEQSLLDGDENGNVYAELSINKAMSLPIFCALHDQKVFKDCEVKELDLSNKLHLLKLSYRAFCAAMAQEKRRNIFYHINPTINNFCQGWLFDMQLAYSDFVVELFNRCVMDNYKDVKSKNITDYDFQIIKTERIPLCLSDVIISEDELWEAFRKHDDKAMLSPIFVHALPYPNESVLIMGYDQRQCNDSILTKIEKWKTNKNVNKVIEDWLIMTNNWCMSPSYFGEEKEAICEEIMMKKMEYQAQINNLK